MKAASREALAKCQENLDERLRGGDVQAAAQTGLDLFEVVSVLDEHRDLRVALTDDAAPVEARQGLVRDLFGSKIADSTARVLEDAVAQNWSTGKEFVNGLSDIGHRALLRGAELQGQLEQVEDELFQLSRILDREGELTQLLSDRTASSAKKRGLLANVLYGKVSMFAEALALQAIGRPEDNPTDDVAELASQAAELRDRTIAQVTVAGELTDNQQAVLAEKLGKIYGRAVSIHTEVDPNLLGGMKIRVGDEVIDGSISGKIARLRTAMSA